MRTLHPTNTAYCQKPHMQSCLHRLDLVSPRSLSLRARINYSDTYSLEMRVLLARIKNSKQDLFTIHGRVDPARNELSCAVRNALVDDLEGERGSRVD